MTHLPTPNFDTPRTIDDLMAHVLDFGAVCAAHGTPDSHDGGGVRRAAAQVIDAMTEPRDRLIGDLRGQRAVLHTLLRQADEVLSTIECECTSEAELMATLRARITNALEGHA